MISETALSAQVLVEVKGTAVVGGQGLPWLEVNGTLTGAGIIRGVDASGATDTLKVGTTNITLYGDIDLGVDLYIKPHSHIRIRHRVTGKAAYTGRILDVSQTVEWSDDRRKKHTYTHVLAADFVQHLANTPRYGVVAPGGRQTWTERIKQLNASLTIWGHPNVSDPVQNSQLLEPWPNGPLGFDGTYWGWTENVPQQNGYLLSLWGAYDYERGLYARIVNPNSPQPPATPMNIAQGAYGIKKTFTGLTPGKAYGLNMKAYVNTPPAGLENARWWRMQVDGKAWSAETRFDSGETHTDATPFGQFQFVATATTHIVRMTNSRAFTIPATGPSAVVAAWIQPGGFYEMGTPDEYLLQDVVYESSLLNQYQLACDSVGARFWVDSKNVTQFRRSDEDLTVSATFSDAALQPGEESYTGLDMSFDTRSVVNSLTMNQHGRQLDENGEPRADDYARTIEDDSSVALWSKRESTMDTCLWLGFEHELDLDQRAREVFARRAVPGYAITHIRWNAQANLALAFSLDIYSRVRVKFEEFEQTARIAQLKHTMTPTRWIVDIWFTDIGTGPTFDAFSDFYAGLTFDQLSDLYAGETFDALAKRPLREH